MGSRGTSSGILNTKTKLKNSLNKRFKHYEYGGYDIYKISGQYAVYDFKTQHKLFDNPSNRLIMVKPTLKAVKSDPDRSIAAKNG